jgi:hypothetical protein
MGHLLFVIYINDLLHGKHPKLQSVICSYDTSILVTVSITEELKTKINSALDYMID